MYASSLTKTASTRSNVRDNPLTLALTVVNGNSASANATVTVVDNTKPTVVTQNVTLYLDASGNASTSTSAVNNGSSDNCTIASYTLSKTEFTYADLGANTVTLTVTDVKVKVNNIDSNVTVQDINR